MSRQFQYSRDGGATWEWSAPDGTIPYEIGTVTIRQWGKPVRIATDHPATASTGRENAEQSECDAALRAAPASEKDADSAARAWMRSHGYGNQSFGFALADLQARIEAKDREGIDLARRLMAAESELSAASRFRAEGGDTKPSTPEAAPVQASTGRRAICTTCPKQTAYGPAYCADCAGEPLEDWTGEKIAEFDRALVEFEQSTPVAARELDVEAERREFREAVRKLYEPHIGPDWEIMLYSANGGDFAFKVWLAARAPSNNSPVGGKD